MNDNLTKARTRVTKSKAKLAMATKKDDVTKARTCVTKGISVGKNQCNSSTLEGKNDFSKAIGAGKEVLVNPFSPDFPKESCESNIPYSEDEITEILGEFQNHELCCLNQRTRILPTMSWLTERKSPSPPPPESVLLERKEERRKLFEKQKEKLRKAFQIVAEKKGHGTRIPE